MINIYLIRHGQAAFAEQDYDKLSEKGIAQAKILGQYWQKLAAVEPSHYQHGQYYSGSLLRHEQTAEHFFNGMNDGFLIKDSTIKQTQTGIITHTGFNELNHEDVLSRYNEKWCSFQKMCEELTLKNKLTNDNSNSKKLFKQEFTQAMQRWVGGDFDEEYQESWHQFKKRCIYALENAISHVDTHCSSENDSNKKNDLVIFTSAGVIGVLIGYVLQLNDMKILQISQQLVNSSVSKIISTNDGFRLNYLNNYSHLELAGREWLSYF